MEPDQVSMAKELLAIRKTALQESLNGKEGKGAKAAKGGKPVQEIPDWVEQLETAERKKMLKAVLAAIERLETDDFGFCSECFVSMPWADISRVPEREICDSCLAKKTSRRLRPRRTKAPRKVKGHK